MQDADDIDVISICPPENQVVWEVRDDQAAHAGDAAKPI
jgi:hypothetical protein